MGMNKSIATGAIWRAAERIIRQGIAMLVYIVLSRILAPEDYGALAILQVFVSISELIATGGLNSALIQHKDVEDRDFASVLWLTLLMSVCFYGILFFAAPSIAQFYENAALIGPLRVIGTILFLYAFNSVQLAWCFRNYAYKQVFIAQICAVTISGVVSIVFAYLGAGLWALVIHSLVSSTVICLVLLITISWKPTLFFSWTRTKQLVSYGWKIMAANLVDRLYAEVSTLSMAKKYSTSALGYYDQGKRYPAVAYDVFGSVIQGVLFPALSKLQEDQESILKAVRRAISMGFYICAPCMIGFALVADNLVKLILTDKWLPAVPYFQIFCIFYLLSIMGMILSQAINGLGRSELTLRLNLIQKGFGLGLIIVALLVFSTPQAVAWAVTITALLTLITNYAVVCKMLNYTVKHFAQDLFPTIGLSLVMVIGIILVTNVVQTDLLCLALQVATGIVLYVLSSAISKNRNFYALLNMLQHR